MSLNEITKYIVGCMSLIRAELHVTSTSIMEYPLIVQYLNILIVLVATVKISCFIDVRIERWNTSRAIRGSSWRLQ